LKVLKLSAQGLPQSWISLEQAVIHYAAGEVRWESGAQIARFRGGHNAVTGEQSVIAINSIIGTKGVPSINPFELKPSLTNSKLFARDRNVCAYCGGHFHEEDLTREHIVPFARNGQDHWMNVVTAQGSAHTGAGAHAAAVCALCAEPVGRLHPAQPTHPGRPDGVPDGARPQVVKVVGVAGGAANTTPLASLLRLAVLKVLSAT
jgi:hypothetical protein